MPQVMGGRTLYGLGLGIMMMDTKFPRVVGDVGNAATWPFPVMYRVVRGAVPERLAQREPDPALLAPFIETARELEADGVRAIITSCGFLAIHQPELAAAVSVPVLTSSLLQVPLAAQVKRPDQVVAIMTAREVLTERHYEGAGWSSRDIPVVQLAPPAEGPFYCTFVGDAPESDPELIDADVARFARRAVETHPDIGAVVLECANFAPFAQTVRRETGLPVFDLYSLGMLAQLTTVGTEFPLRI